MKIPLTSQPEAKPLNGSVKKKVSMNCDEKKLR
jgi:hypothetical protein